MKFERFSQLEPFPSSLFSCHIQVLCNSRRFGNTVNDSYDNLLVRWHTEDTAAPSEAGRLFDTAASLSATS